MNDRERYGTSLTLNRPTMGELKEGLRIIESTIDQVDKEVGLDRATLEFEIHTSDKGDVLLLWRARRR